MGFEKEDGRFDPKHRRNPGPILKITIFGPLDFIPPFLPARTVCVCSLAVVASPAATRDPRGGGAEDRMRNSGDRIGCGRCYRYGWPTGIERNRAPHHRGRVSQDLSETGGPQTRTVPAPGRPNLGLGATNIAQTLQQSVPLVRRTFSFDTGGPTIPVYAKYSGQTMQ